MVSQVESLQQGNVIFLSCAVDMPRFTIVALYPAVLLAVKSVFEVAVATESVNKGVG